VGRVKGRARRRMSIGCFVVRGRHDVVKEVISYATAHRYAGVCKSRILAEARMLMSMQIIATLTLTHIHSKGREVTSGLVPDLT